MMLSVTDVVEHEFCPIFTYYTKVMELKQYEEKRGTVKAGKQFHVNHENRNRNYLINNIKGRKLTAAKYFSKQLGIVGKIDEAIETDDEIVIIERKYSDYNVVTNTIKVQIGLLALLVEENRQKPVRNAIIIFAKNSRNIINVEITDQLKKFALERLQETKNVINNEIMPESNYDNRCTNCCFRKICPTGSLNNKQ